MALDDEKQQKIRSHLEGRNNRCPVCDTNKWIIFDDLISPICFDIEYRRPIEGKFFPFVALICNECGYIWQMSAMKVGLIG